MVLVHRFETKEELVAYRDKVWGNGVETEKRLPETEAAILHSLILTAPCWGYSFCPEVLP